MNKEPRKGCPNCEYTIQYKLYRANLDKELAKVNCTRQEARNWNADYLIELLGEVAYQAGLYKTTGRKWTVVTAMLVGIYRDEIAKMRAAEQYALVQAAENARRNQPQRPDDDDDID